MPDRRTRATGGRRARSGPLDPQRVTRVAATVLERDGLDRFTLAAVAEELGVTQPALYRHVAGYDDLLARLALDARHQLLDALRESTVGRSGDDALRAAANAWRAFVREHPQQYATTDRSPLPGDAANQAAARAVVDLLARVLTGYGSTLAVTQQTAWALRSALHGFADLEVRQGWPSASERDATFDRLIEVLIAGLHAGPSA
ncbi:MAG: WHG domain-containing protein [Actinomycetes bacterium]